MIEIDCKITNHQEKLLGATAQAIGETAGQQDDNVSAFMTPMLHGELDFKVRCAVREHLCCLNHILDRL